MNSQLRPIADLIKSQQFDQARQQIVSYLKQHPDDAWGWYLRSFVESSRNQKIAAASRALRLSPDHDTLKTRLAKLQTGQPARRWGLLAAGVFAVALIVGVLVLQGGLPQSTDAPLPTLAMLPTSVPTEIALEISSAAEEQGTEATLVNTPMVSSQTQAPTLEATFADLPTSVEATAVISGEIPVSLPSPTLVQIVEATATVAIQDVAPSAVPENPSTDLPSENSTPSAPIRPTRPGSTTLTPVASPTLAPVVATPIFGSITETGVPMNTAINIGVGEMRVVAVTRPAEQYIAELGGTVPSAPSDQAWVLVEALLICNDERNCTMNPSALWSVASSGAAYNPSPQFNLPPTFGSVLSNSQVWGYLGFLVPKNEESLRLVLVQAGQTYVFALQ